MSSSNCCFLTCIKVSQETGQMVWHSHLFKNLPQFIVIHIVKGFGIVNKAEIDVFLELSCFFDDPADVGNLISGSSVFSKTSLNIWKFMVHIWPWSTEWSRAKANRVLPRERTGHSKHPLQTTREKIHMDITRWSTPKSAKTGPGADCGSDHELLIVKFRLKLKKVGKTTRQFRYNLNQKSCNKH